MGILDQNAQPTQPVMPAEQASGEPQPNVSPEEQAEYDQFIDNAHLLLYSDDGNKAVLERIQASPSPIEAVAAIAAQTVIRLQDSAEKAGSPVSQDVLFNGGIEIVEELADMTKEAGIYEFTDKDLETAIYQTMDEYQRLAEGTIDQNAAAQDVEMLKQADASGQLEQMLPGLSGRGAG